MKKIVISAVNLKVGGTLTILRDCLRHLSGLAATGEYQVIEEELVKQALV